MKVTSAVGVLLLASTAVAAPAKSKFTEKRHERLAKRLAKNRSRPPLPLNYTSMGETVSVYNPGYVTYDSNWAGAVIESSGITDVVGTFTVPTVSTPSSGGSDEYGAAAWVGIDGDSCQTAILQTGVEFIIENGEASYNAWYEWYPDYSYNFDNFDVSPGDSIKASVHADSTTSGTATIENLTTGDKVTHTFTNEGSTGSLCQTDAEWIVEDFESNSQLIPFADFGTVTFTDSSYTADGSTSGVDGSSILDVKQDNEVVTDCGTTGSDQVYCKYI